MIDFPHKIVIPQRPDYLVARPRLIDLLMAIRERRLITLSAPAGYGKTSLLTDFASVVSDLPVCWYTLDRFDEDPWVFLDYLATAIAQRFPGATQATMAMLDGRARTPFSTAAATLVRDMYALRDDFVLVIDDWHLVDHVPDITDLVAQVLLHCPHCHLILASRIYPSLTDLMLLAARRQLSGLDEEHLRFTPPEIAAVLGAEYHVTIADDQAQALADQSNGWITGVLLACQVTGPHGAAQAPHDARAERFIYRYLAEQVFDQQPPAIRTFLLESSLLEELTPERCDAIFDRRDSGQILETLLRQHLFITEIRSGVLRYHPLFREFLHDHFRTSDPQRYHCLALRVADGYVAHRQWSLAFESCVQANDLIAAQRIASTGGMHLYTAGRLETLERWFTVLPQDDLDASLLCVKARMLIDYGQLHEAQAVIDLATARMQPHEQATVLLQQAYLARVGGRYAYALEIGQHVLQLVQDDAQRATVLHVLATCHHRLGQTSRAIDQLHEALAIERQRGDLYAMALLKHDLGVCHEGIGLLQMAEEYYTQAEAYWATINNMGRRAISLNSKGVVQHQRGLYQEAHATLQTALDYAQQVGIGQYQATVLISLGDLYTDLGLWTHAHGVYQDAQQTVSTAFLLGYLELARIRLAVRQHQYAAADRSIQQLGPQVQEMAQGGLNVLQADIACGVGDYEQAQVYADQAIAILAGNGASVDLARAYLVSARILASDAPMDHAQLIATLEQARGIAQQLGHDAFLVAETQHMRQTLRHARSLGWEPAEEWLQRHQTLLLIAQQVTHQQPHPVLLVRTLGTDQIIVDGVPADLGWRKAREIFFYLLAHPEGVLIDTLRDMFWPELSPERSRGSLKSAIYQLRSALPQDTIRLVERRVYQLNRASVVLNYDVERIVNIVTEREDDSEALFEAIELYRGPYLPWSEHDWSHATRVQLEQRYLQALRHGAKRGEQRKAFADALILYTQIVQIDPLDEAAHAGLMRCHIALGNRAAAVHQYQLLRTALDAELGLDIGPASEAEQVYRHMLAVS